VLVLFEVCAVLVVVGTTVTVPANALESRAKESMKAVLRCFRVVSLADSELRLRAASEKSSRTNAGGLVTFAPEGEGEGVLAKRLG